MLRTAFCTVLMLAPVSMAGDLTPPPGPVAPTMLTLDTMEPRTPITQADLPLSISDEGSYFLTENLVPTSLNQPFLIEINASNVTLDLNGFTLIGITEVSTAADGISVEAGSTGVRIFNGAVRDCSQAGINGVAGTGVSIENVRVSSCSIGVALGAQGKALGCVAEACFAGISVSRQCTIVECTANNNLSTGFSAVEHTTFTTCTAMDNGSHGFSAGTGASLRGCVAFRNGLDGFVLGATSALVGCTSNSNMSDGFTSRGGTFQACAARGNRSE